MSPPDRHGHVSLGTGANYGAALCGDVRVFAEVNARMPRAEVLVSSTVKDLVAGSGLRFVDRGTYALHGVPGECASSPRRHERVNWGRQFVPTVVCGK